MVKISYRANARAITRPIQSTKRWRQGTAICGALLAVGLGMINTPAMAKSKPLPAQNLSGKANAKLWPKVTPSVTTDPAIEAKIDALLAQMSLEEKIGQVIQPELQSVTPEDVRRYHIGSIENGGGSTPGKNKHASVKTWVDTIEAYYQASIDPKAHKVVIPMIWATDAVHGHNNVFGATLFPHNIGLGAAHDPDLIHRIGEATAKEVRSLGMDWSFAPTIAVARDDRWGRSYESYSEDPKIVETYAKAMVTGLQGSGKTFLDQDHVISTAKHFLGDGGTEGGRDQGETRISEAELSRIHGSGYRAAVGAGVQSVMASFNSWQGLRMHANKALMTGILKDHMGFDGMIMGDWNAHGQIPGCTNSDCATTLNAGLDVYNVPQDWKALYGNLLRDVKSGVIPMTRVDDAVRRVLRVKFRALVFDQPSPANRPNSFKPIGTPEHRAIAREAVRKSLVLLKNNNSTLPIKPGKTILITGDGADNITMQTGGWTLSWQGNDNGPGDFPGATSIYEGLKAQAEATGGQVLLSSDGASPQKPDVAIVVFGEKPYAEFQGDQSDVALHYGNDESLELLKKLKAQGIPVVAVMLSGRPLYVNPQINMADAFVAAFLPGSEGGGLADVLLAKADGTPQYDFNGRLSFSWPKRPNQTPLNVGDKNYDPQFAFGFGLSYAKPVNTPALAEVAETTNYGEKGVYYSKGKMWNGYRLSIGDANAPFMEYVGTPTTLYGSAALSLNPDTVTPGVNLNWNGRQLAWVEVSAAKPSDLAREANGAMMISITLKLNSGPDGPVNLGIGKASLPITARLKAMTPGTFQALSIPLSCFAKGQDLSQTPTILHLETPAKLDLTISDIRLIETRGDVTCPGE